MRKKSLIVLGVSLLLWLSFLLVGCKDKKELLSQEEKRIELIYPEKRREKESYTLSGILVPSSEITLSVPLDAKVTKKKKEAGSKVKKGELLYQLENQDLLWQLEELKIVENQLIEEKRKRNIELADSKIEAQKSLLALENQEIALQIKENQLKEVKEQKRKMEEMVQLGAGVQSDVRLLENQLQQLELDLKSQTNNKKMAFLGLQEEDLIKRYQLKGKLSPTTLQHYRIQKLIEPYEERIKQIEQALQQNQREQHYLKKKKELLTLFAPCDGYLFEAPFQQGEWIAAKEKIALIRVENPLKAMVRIPREQLEKVSEQKEYPITLFYQREQTIQAKGKVDAILSGVDAATGEMGLVLLVDNAQARFQPGDYFEWKLEGKEKRKWKVPLSAIREQKGQYEILFWVNERINILPVKGSYDEKEGFSIEDPPEIEAPIINYPSEQMIEGGFIGKEQIKKEEKKE